MIIKNQAITLVKKYHTSCPFKLAKELNITILYEDIGNIMGYFSKDYRFKFIHINKNLPHITQQFVCAHELGHGILHTDVSTPFLSRYTLFSVSKIEREANIFAVELLLPDEVLQEYKDISLYTLAAKCGIPEKLADLKRKD